MCCVLTEVGGTAEAGAFVSRQAALIDRRGDEGACGSKAKALGISCSTSIGTCSTSQAAAACPKSSEETAGHIRIPCTRGRAAMQHQCTVQHVTRGCSTLNIRLQEAGCMPCVQYARELTK